ncbi:Mitochondrial carrier protein LEU5 [Saitozyma sp. JCM 24511]|nr:Mitochondrial carrier protein LEU5 [Saitozyma sp. JCM 24511]
MENNPPISSDRKGKSRAIDISTPSPAMPLLDEQHPLSRESERWTAANLWRESRKRAQADRNSWDYVLSSGIAGGIAGCVAKSAIAPLDRVKILFQTSNADFRKYAGTPMGLLHAIRIIYKSQGVRGLYQGHSMTLLRIFPYAGIKYMAYDALEGLLIPTPDKQTSGRLFLAGALSGVTSVLCTYPLELIRVRLAYQTRESERTSLREAIRTIYREADLVPPSGTKPSVSKFTRSLPFYPFYRGFSISILGMIPYAGVSFLTYGTLKRHITQFIPYLESRPTQKYLACGAVAGMVSQTASYPFEVVRRRMQVGGAFKGGGISWREAVSAIYQARGWRGFFVGLSIGYIKVVPMTSISFATWQFMKRVFEI